MKIVIFNRKFMLHYPLDKIKMRPVHSLKKFCAALLCLTLSGAVAEASDPVLSSINRAAESTVFVTAETGGAFKDKPVGIIDENTGIILIQQPIRVVQYNRTGGGIILDSSGIIVTNNHTVTNAGRIVVTLLDGTNITASLLAAYPEDDIAILKINSPTSLRAIEFADLNKAKPGDTVYAIGNSPMLKNSISEGQITGIGTAQPKPEEPAFISLVRVNFDVYEGDSGAPVLDSKGRLIGIFVARETAVGKMSYAIPGNIIRKRYREYLVSTIK